ncbi:MAG TPA: ABC transporter ATP-binding protein [Trueperaceae bacterium]
MAPVLRCRSLVRSFVAGEERVEVLRGVDLEVRSGEVAAVLGPSGSGKSTLLHLLAGLDSPSAGEIYWGDFPVHDYPPQALAARRASFLGLVFQQHYLLEDMDVLDNVTLPGRIHGRLDRAQGRQLLDSVGLSDRANFLPRLLSGGERQRVAVARALYGEPSVILADEPTGSLDRENARTVFHLLVELARKRGTSVVMVTHDAGLVAEVDSRYRLEDGKLVRLANEVVSQV